VKERLGKYLSRMGIASRREADRLIAGGSVQVNGLPVPPSGMLIDPDADLVTLNGTNVATVVARVYYALNKPRGYVSTVKDRHAEKLVIDLVPPHPPVYPVGRLDRDTEGLIILTNDGDLAYRLTHPSFEHEREYRVHARWKEPVPAVEGRERLRQLATGMRLEDGMTLPAVLTIKSIEGQSVLFHLVLREGRNRQVRRMCRALGLQIERLMRVRIGRLALQGIAPGKYRLVKVRDIL